MIRRGTIGSHRYYCISFRRHNPEQMVLVADRQGRIKHVSVSLAKLLDTTVEHLQVSNESVYNSHYNPHCLSMMIFIKPRL